MLGTFIGHTVQRSLLQRQLTSAKVAGAYLLYGPAGLGKNYLTSTIINDLLCQVSDSACRECVDCRWFVQNSHPDVYRLRADEPLTVDVARLINEFARTSAVRPNGRKWIIIEKTGTMTTEAANALLKLLEEPPQNVIFFLLAERSEAVLATVRSRCQLIKLLPLSESDMRQILKVYPMSVGDQDLILGLSLGRPGRALALAKGQLSEYQALVPELMKLLQSDITTSFRALKHWLDTVIKTQDTVEAKFNLMNFRLNYLELLVRDAVFSQVQSDYVVNQQQAAQLQLLSRRYSVRSLMSMLKHISGLRAQLSSRSSNQQLCWENFIINLKQLAQN